MSESYSGEIPPIADNEKKGRKIKVPPDEPYVQQLTTNVELNIPAPN